MTVTSEPMASADALACAPTEANLQNAAQSMPPELAAQHAAITAACAESAPALEAHMRAMLTEFADVFDGGDLDTDAIRARVAGLAAHDSTRYARLHDLDQHARALLGALQERAQSAARAARGEVAGRLLSRLVPEWRDPAVAAQELEGVRSYLVQQGFPSDAVAQLDDPYDLAMARKAMLYDRMIATARERTSAPPPPPRAIGPSLPELKDRLAQSGRVEDAAAVIERLLRDGTDDDAI